VRRRASRSMSLIRSCNAAGKDARGFSGIHIIVRTFVSTFVRSRRGKKMAQIACLGYSFKWESDEPRRHLPTPAVVAAAAAAAAAASAAASARKVAVNSCQPWTPLSLRQRVAAAGKSLAGRHASVIALRRWRRRVGPAGRRRRGLGRTRTKDSLISKVGSAYSCIFCTLKS
jgi:hypothetical protein